MQVIAGEWAIYQNELWFMTDNMEKVSSWELLRTLHGAALKLEKMGGKGEKEKNYVHARIRTHAQWKAHI